MIFEHAMLASWTDTENFEAKGAFSPVWLEEVILRSFSQQALAYFKNFSFFIHCFSQHCGEQFCQIYCRSMNKKHNQAFQVFAIAGFWINNCCAFCKKLQIDSILLLLCDIQWSMWNLVERFRKHFIAFRILAQSSVKSRGCAMSHGNASPR